MKAISETLGLSPSVVTRAVGRGLRPGYGKYSRKLGAGVCIECGAACSLTADRCQTCAGGHTDTMALCRTCKQWLPRESFSANPQVRLRGVRSSCRKCESAAAMERTRAEPEKKAARMAVYFAVRSGKLVRQPCEVCGAENAQAHHDDYSRKLDVRWLCATHHAEHHAAAF